MNRQLSNPIQTSHDVLNKGGKLPANWPDTNLCDSFWMIKRVVGKFKRLRKIFSCPVGWQDAHEFHLGIVAFLWLPLGTLAGPLDTSGVNGAKVVCLAYGTSTDDPGSINYLISFHLPNVITITDTVRNGAFTSPGQIPNRGPADYFED